MNITTDRPCDSCGADWRGSVECPICGHLDNVAGLVTVCGWCDTRHALMAEAQAQGMTVSHGMCEFHAVTLWAEATDAYRARLVVERAS